MFVIYNWSRQIVAFGNATYKCMESALSDMEILIRHNPEYCFEVICSDEAIRLLQHNCDYYKQCMEHILLARN